VSPSTLEVKAVLSFRLILFTLLYTLNDTGEGEGEGDLDGFSVASLLGDLDRNPLIVAQLLFLQKVSRGSS